MSESVTAPILKILGAMSHFIKNPSGEFPHHGPPPRCRLRRQRARYQANGRLQKCAREPCCLPQSPRSPQPRLPCRSTTPRHASPCVSPGQLTRTHPRSSHGRDWHWSHVRGRALPDVGRAHVLRQRPPCDGQHPLPLRCHAHHRLLKDASLLFPKAQDSRDVLLPRGHLSRLSGLAHVWDGHRVLRLPQPVWGFFPCRVGVLAQYASDRQCALCSLRTNNHRPLHIKGKIACVIGSGHVACACSLQHGGASLMLPRRSALGDEVFSRRVRVSVLTLT